MRYRTVGMMCVRIKMVKRIKSPVHALDESLAISKMSAVDWKNSGIYGCNQSASGKARSNCTIERAIHAIECVRVCFGVLSLYVNVTCRYKWNDERKRTSKAVHINAAWAIRARHPLKMLFTRDCNVSAFSSLRLRARLDYFAPFLDDAQLMWIDTASATVQVQVYGMKHKVFSRRC